MSKLLLKSLSVLLMGFSAQANLISGFSESCLDTTEAFNQCLEDYNLANIPGKKWCSVRPIRPQVRTSDFIVSQLEINAQTNRLQFASFFVPNPEFGEGETRMIARASGEWSLEINHIDVKFDPTANDSPQVFPSRVHVDFHGLDQSQLVVSEVLGAGTPTFGALLFTECSKLGIN